MESKSAPSEKPQLVGPAQVLSLVAKARELVAARQKRQEKEAQEAQAAISNFKLPDLSEVVPPQFSAKTANRIAQFDTTLDQLSAIEEHSKRITERLKAYDDLMYQCKPPPQAQEASDGTHAAIGNLHSQIMEAAAFIGSIRPAGFSEVEIQAAAESGEGASQTEWGEASDHLWWTTFENVKHLPAQRNEIQRLTDLIERRKAEYKVLGDELVLKQRELDLADACAAQIKEEMDAREEGLIRRGARIALREQEVWLAEEACARKVKAVFTTKDPAIGRSRKDAAEEAAAADARGIKKGPSPAPGAAKPGSKSQAAAAQNVFADPAEFHRSLLNVQLRHASNVYGSVAQGTKILTLKPLPKLKNQDQLLTEARDRVVLHEIAQRVKEQSKLLRVTLQKKFCDPKTAPIPGDLERLISRERELEGEDKVLKDLLSTCPLEQVSKGTPESIIGLLERWWGENSDRLHNRRLLLLHERSRHLESALELLKDVLARDYQPASHRRGEVSEQ